MRLSIFLLVLLSAQTAFAQDYTPRLSPLGAYGLSVEKIFDRYEERDEDFLVAYYQYPPARENKYNFSFRVFGQDGKYYYRKRRIHSDRYVDVVKELDAAIALKLKALFHAAIRKGQPVLPGEREGLPMHYSFSTLCTYNNKNVLVCGAYVPEFRFGEESSISKLTRNLERYVFPPAPTRKNKKLSPVSKEGLIAEMDRMIEVYTGLDARD